MATAEAIVRPDVSAGKDVDVRGVVAKRDPKRAVASAKEPVSDSPACSGEDRYRMIAEAAYYRAESRGFEGGSDLDDWLAAEMEIDQILGAVEPIDDA
jgi:hypothetical protein